MAIKIINGVAVVVDSNGNPTKNTSSSNSNRSATQQRIAANEAAERALDEKVRVEANEVTASAPLNTQKRITANERAEYQADLDARNGFIPQIQEVQKRQTNAARRAANEKADYDADREASRVVPTASYKTRVQESEAKIKKLQQEAEAIGSGLARMKAYGGNVTDAEKNLQAKYDEISRLKKQIARDQSILDQAHGKPGSIANAERAAAEAQIEKSKTRNPFSVNADQARAMASAAANNSSAKKELQQKFKSESKAYQEASRNVVAAERNLEAQQYTDKLRNTTYADNAVGQFKASYTAGRAGQDISLAWSRYLSDPSEANKRYARELEQAYAEFEENNKETLADDATLPLITQSWASYLPQLGDQIKAGVKGGATGLAVGAIVGAPFKGAKVGATAASGLYSYEMARGAAFKALRDLGVDEETAKKAASDEAVISSIIEMGDTAITLFSLGTTKMLEAVGKEGIKGLGTYLAKWAGEDKAKNFLIAAGKYVLNLGSEGAEEWLQEGVSIANQNRFASGNTNNSLLGDSTKVLWNAITGKDKEAQAQMAEAFGGGVKIALMSPLMDVTLQGTAAGINTVYNATLEAKVGAEVKGMYGDMGLITSTLENSAQDSTSRKIADALKKRIENGGKAPTDLEIGKLFRAIQEEAQAKEAAEAAKQTKAEQQKTDDLAQMVQSDDTAVSEYAAAQLTSPDQKVVSPYAQELMDAGMTPEKATAQSDLIEKVVSGHNLTKAEASNLKLSDQSVRQVFIKATGTEVTDGQARNASQARKIIRSAAEVAQARAKLQEQQAQQVQQAQAAPAPESDPITPSVAPESEPIAPESPATDMEQNTTARPPFLSKDAAEQALLSILERANTRQEQNAQTQQTAEPTIRFADGTTMTATQFEERFLAENPNASADDVLAAFQNRAAYNAMGQPIPGSAATASMRPSLTEPADGQDIVGRTMSDNAQRAAQDLTVKMLDNLGKKLGVSVRLEDSMDTPANGYYDSQTKTIVLNRQRATTQRMVVYYFAHELVHHGTAIDGQSVVQNILDAAKLMGDEDWLARKTDQVWKTYTAFHEKRGESFTEAMRDEEVAADYLH